MVSSLNLKPEANPVLTGDYFLLERASGSYKVLFNTISGQMGGGGGGTTITNGITGISVTGSNSITGKVNLNGQNGVSLFLNGNDINFSGQSNQLIQTGINLYSFASAVSGNLATTGHILDDKINSLSGSAGGITGNGSYSYMSKWIAVSGLGHSIIFDSGNKIGILTNLPTTLLDISGDLSLREKIVTSLQTGINKSISIFSGYSFIKIISGASGNFRIDGIVSSGDGIRFDGKHHYIYNDTPYNLVVSHESSNETVPSNRITNLYNRDLIITPSGKISLIYDINKLRWTTFSYNTIENFGNGINVKLYGAYGDGNSHPLSNKYPSLQHAQNDFPFITDISQEMDYAAIQLSLNLSNKTFIPSGIYILGASTININGGRILEGEGCTNYVNDYSTLIKYTGNNTAIQVNNGLGNTVHGFELRDFTLDGVGMGGVGITYGISAGSPKAAKGLTKNIAVNNFLSGNLILVSAQGKRFSNVYSKYSSGAGLLIDNRSGGANTAVIFNGCEFSYNSTGIIIKNGEGISFNSCISESNLREGAVINRSQWPDTDGSQSISNVSFYDCHLEANQTNPIGSSGIIGQFVTTSNHTNGGACGTTNIYGGTWIQAGAETGSNSNINRIFDIKSAVVNMYFVRPNSFTYPMGRIWSDGYASNTHLTQYADYSPYGGTPTSFAPITGVTSFRWETTGTSSLIYIYTNAGERTEFYSQSDGTLWEFERNKNTVGKIFKRLTSGTVLGLDNNHTLTTSTITLTQLNSLPTNLYQTGSSLYNFISLVSGDLTTTGISIENKFDILSGWISTSPTNIVYTTGTQSIIGAKTFNNDITISGYYRNSVGGPAGKNLIPISTDGWKTNQNIFKYKTNNTAIISIVPVTGLVAGGNAHQFQTDSSNTNGSWYYIDQLIQINPDYTYQGKIWASRTHGSGSFYAGYIAYDSGINELGGNGGTYGYFIASAQSPPLTGIYFKSRIAGQGATITTFPTGTRYIRPLIIINQGAISGIMQVGDFEITNAPSLLDLENTGISLKAQLDLTGTNLYSYSSSISGNLQTTGSVLDNKIISLSGSINSFLGPFVTGINITGGKSFTGLISFTGSNIIITTITGQVGMTGNFVNFSGDTTILSTVTNLYSTGSTLDNKINTFSGGGQIVYTTGGQTVNGIKNFVGPIGVNVAVPTLALEVKGQTLIQTNTASPYLKISGSTANTIISFAIANGTNNLVFGDIAGDVDIFGTPTKINFSADNGTTNHFQIQSNGNVGISTRNTSEKLQISGGNVLIDNNQSYKIKTNAGVTAIALGSNSTNDTSLQSLTTTSSLFLKNGANTAITITGQKVGIGFSNPSYNVDISGDLGISGGVIFDKYIINQLNSGYSGATDLTHIFNFNSNSTQLVTLSGVPNNIFTFSGAGMGAGKELKAIITTTGIITGMVYPTAWSWINQKPSGLNAGAKFVITLTCTGSNDDGVIASYGRAVGGGGIGTSVQGNGTNNYIPKWSNSTTLTNSTIIDDSLTVQATGNFGVTGNLTTNALIISSQKVNFIGNNVSGGDPKINTLSLPVSSPVFGGTSGLMGVPAGWLQINISGNSYKLPYYN